MILSGESLAQSPDSLLCNIQGKSQERPMLGFALDVVAVPAASEALGTV